MHVLGPSGLGQGPSPSGLERGDIILTAPVTPVALDGLIYAAQHLAYPDYDAAFTHAALYLGNDTIIDSMPGQPIAAKPITAAIDGCVFRALRLKGIGPAKQWDVCNAALALTGHYGYVRAAADWLVQNALLPGHWKQMLAKLVAAFGSAGYYYCSQYVNEAYNRGIQVTVVGGRSFVPLPSAFSASQLFEDVDIRW